MTAANLKVKVVRRAQIKLKVMPRFPSNVTAESPILLDTTGGSYDFSLDIDALDTSLPDFARRDTTNTFTQTQTITPAAGALLIGNNTADAIARWPGTKLPVLVIDRSVNWTGINDNTVTDMSVLTAIDSVSNQYASWSSRLTTANNAFNWNHLAGFEDLSNFSGSGTLAEQWSFLSLPNYTGSGAVTNRRAFRAFDITGTATVTNNYGFYADSLAYGTNNFAFYAAGTTPSRFGNVLVGNNTTASTPSATNILQLVNADGSNTGILAQAFGTGNFVGLGAQVARGTKAAPTQSKADDLLLSIGVQPYNNSSAFDASSRASLLFWAGQDQTATAQGAYATIYTTPNGSTTPAESIRFTASGGVGFGATTDVPLGVVNLLTGIRIGNAAASGNVLRGNGTNFVSSTLGFSDLTGSVAASQMPALTGDITTSAGAVATTLATVNSNVGTFGSATKASVVTVNGKGLVTAASESTVTPAVGSITGLGTGVATALGVNVGSAGAFVTFNGAGGTPSSLTLTNATGLSLSTGVTGTLQAAQEPAHTGDVTNTAGSLALAIGATKVTSAMLNADVFSTAHSWAGQQTFTAPILGTPASGTVTNLTGTASININGTVGATTPGTGAFTTLSASSTVSGAGFSTYLASPPAIGGTAAAAGSFTTLSATGLITGTASTGIVLNANVTSYMPTSPNLISARNVDGTGTGLVLQTYGNATNTFVGITGQVARGSAASPTQSKANDLLLAFGVQPYNNGGAFSSGNRASVVLWAGEDQTSTAQGTYASIFTTPNGSTTAGEVRIFGSTGIGINTTSDPGAGLIYTNSASFLMRTKTSLTGGGTGNVPTLTTGPVTGNPTKWLPYDDNGTTRYIPSW